MILRIEIPQELIRQDAEIVIKVNNRNNALGYVIENGSEHDALQIAKEDTNVCPMLSEYVRELTQRFYKNGKYRSADIYMCTLRSFMRFRKEKDLLITEAIWTRYMPSRKMIDDIISSGVIGEVAAVTANLN